MGKRFSCTWLLDVKCPHKKFERQRFLSRCEKCVHYQVFMREMEEEDARVMEEIDRIQRTGRWE